MNRRLRRRAFLDGRGRYYGIAPADTVGGGKGHPFRSRRTAERWARIRTKVSRTEWQVYRFDR